MTRKGQGRREGYSESDLRLAIGIVMLADRAAAAEFTGISVRQVYHRLEKNGEWLNTVMGWLEEAFRLRRSRVKEVTEDRMVAELVRLYGKALAAAEDKLEKGDGPTAIAILKEALDRTKGKSLQPVEHNGTQKHVHYVLPPAVVESLTSVASVLESAARLYSLTEIKRIAAPIEITPSDEPQS